MANEWLDMFLDYRHIKYGLRAILQENKIINKRQHYAKNLEASNCCATELNI